MPENTDTVTKPGAYVTVPEAAALASLSEPAIRRAVREGRLSAVTVDGGRWLVDRLDLTRYARIARRKPAPGVTSGTTKPAPSVTGESVPSVTSTNPVTDGNAVVLASQIENLETVVAVALARIEALETALADAQVQLQIAAPPRRWWHRLMALGEPGDSAAK